MKSDSFPGKTAIAGIGQTEFSKNSGRSEMRLAVEAVSAALADAGLEPADVDGYCTFTMDNNPGIEINRYLGGGDLTFFSRIHYGGGAACATVLQAALAVSSGVADTVVCYRAMNERSMQRFGAGVQDRPPIPTTESAHFGWYAPYGLVTPASWVAMSASRYMHEYGATSEDFGRVAVADRKHAATNPAAWFFGKPITLEDHQRSRFIVEPLRLLDCCQESDGAVAVVVTSRERARDLRQKPAVIAAAAQGASREQQMMTGYYAREIAGLPEMGLVARQLWAQSGLSSGRHPDRRDLRPLHALRAGPARGVRLLPARRGQGVPARRTRRDRRAPADQHARGTARRGLHPRHERHRRGRSPGARQRGQPDQGRASTWWSPRAPASRPAA